MGGPPEQDVSGDEGLVDGLERAHPPSLAASVNQLLRLRETPSWPSRNVGPARWVSHPPSPNPWEPMTTSLVRTRHATPLDVDAVTDLHAAAHRPRCAAASTCPSRRCRRDWSAGSSRHATAGACWPSSAARGRAGLAGPLSADALEVGLLVEDRHQGSGVGARLLRDVARDAPPRLPAAGLPGRARQRRGAADRAPGRPRGCARSRSTASSRSSSRFRPAAAGSAGPPESYARQNSRRAHQERA